MDYHLKYEILISQEFNTNADEKIFLVFTSVHVRGSGNYKLSQEKGSILVHPKWNKLKSLKVAKWRITDEGWRLKDERWKMKDEGRGVLITDRQTNRLTDICDCRVAFATENAF